jgi:hypothetical protein
VIDFFQRYFVAIMMVSYAIMGAFYFGHELGITKGQIMERSYNSYNFNKTIRAFSNKE